MADTFGTLVDKLTTVDLKMWNNQEEIYKIRKMTFEEYKERYFTNEKGAEELWRFLAKACDLNLQRNQLIYELDQKLVEMIEKAVAGKIISTPDNIQNPHKTY